MKEYRLPGNFSSSKFISPVNEQLLRGGLHGAFPTDSGPEAVNTASTPNVCFQYSSSLVLIDWHVTNLALAIYTHKKLLLSYRQGDRWESSWEGMPKRAKDGSVGLGSLHIVIYS